MSSSAETSNPHALHAPNEANHDSPWRTQPEWRQYLVATLATTDEERESSDTALSSMKVNGYEGFGSFHSGNVEELVALPDHLYQPPPWPAMPWVCQAIPHSTNHTPHIPNGIVGASGAIWSVRSDSNTSPPVPPPTPFGLPFLQEHFLVSRDFVFVNHGAFGGALLGAQTLKEHLDRYMETQILRFFDREMLPLLVYVVRCLCKFIHSPVKNVVLVQNATTGLNSAIRHLIKAKDVVAYLDTEYLSVYKMAYIRCQEVDATLHEIPVNKLLHNADVMGSDEELTRYIVGHLPPFCTVFIVDYITSSSALELPVFTHIIPALRAAGVERVIVDGAHTALQVNIDFSSLPPSSRPDAFAANLHKWLSCPKAAAYLWVKDEHIKHVEPVVLSHGAREGFLSSFIWDGTRDYSAYLTIPAVLQFWEAQGIARVRDRCSKLLRDATVMLTSAFRSRLVPRHAPFLSLVELPDLFQGRRDITGKYVQDVLHSYYRLEVPVKQIEGRLYFRISAFAYNDESHYAYLRDAMLDFAERIRKRPRDDGAPCPAQLVGGCGLAATQSKMAGFDDDDDN